MVTGEGAIYHHTPVDDYAEDLCESLDVEQLCESLDAQQRGSELKAGEEASLEELVDSYETESILCGVEAGKCGSVSVGRPILADSPGATHGGLKSSLEAVLSAAWADLIREVHVQPLLSPD